jgi:hypothetical protein
VTRPLPNDPGWVKQAYSSYQTQQAMRERIDSLEKYLAMLVRITVANQTTPEAVAVLNQFADMVIESSAKET